MRTFLLASLAAVGAAGFAVACSATNDTNGFKGTGAGAGGPGGTGGDDIGFTTGTGTGAGAGVLGEEPPCEGVDPNLDNDGDGWIGAAGDCNDCTPQMNPGAQDYLGNNIDEDCNGQKDDPSNECDANLALDGSDGLDGARAMGLCKMASGESWGVKSAQWVAADGSPLQNYDPSGLGHGILGGFGPNVNAQEGVKMLALSSGTARTPSDAGYQPVSGYDKFYTTGTPAGYPKTSPACMIEAGESHDSAGLRVTIKTPTNAKSLSFNLNFYTYEFPGYICSTYNDFFVAMLSPMPAGTDGNISFDSQGNTISVNAGFLEVCHPQTASNGAFFNCALGPEQLAGTGFDEDIFGPTDNSAATGWLQTTAPVENPGGDIDILFTIWDSGDGILDSTILLDNFVFEVEPSETGTAPVPVPK